MSDAPAAAPLHRPVMAEEVLRLLDPKPGETIVDGTLGTAGHSKAILGALDGSVLLVGLDRDPNMAAIGRRELAACAGARVEVLTANFRDLKDALLSLGIEAADGVLLDLGFASPQVDDATRGFSYRSDGPLDMRMGSGDEGSAEEWIHSASQEEIARVLWEYGEERFSRRIAKAIVEARRLKPIRRTGELAEIIARAAPRGPRRLHPARRSFQALRIHVNGEMEHLDAFLRALPSVLRAGGRCAIISYHSLEDRRVKNAFRAGVVEGQYEALTRKPLRPSPAEVCANPRSRSARLRAVLKISEGTET